MGGGFLVGWLGEGREVGAERVWWMDGWMDGWVLLGID